MISNIVPQNITEEARKKKTCSGVQKTERPLAANITIKKNDTAPQYAPRKYYELKDDLFEEHLWELFSHRPFKNGYACLHFLRVYRKVFP